MLCTWFSRFCFFSWKGVSLCARTKKPKEAQVAKKRRWRPLPSNEGNARWPNDVVSSITKTWRFGVCESQLFFFASHSVRECFLNFFLALIACGHQRTAKQCHERWVNHLRPDIRRGCWTEEEDAKLIDVYAQQGNRFTKIAEDLGRSGIDVRNRIYSTQRMVTRYLEGKLTNNIRRHGILFVSCYNIFTPLSWSPVFASLLREQVRVRNNQTENLGVPSKRQMCIFF